LQNNFIGRKESRILRLVYCKQNQQVDPSNRLEMRKKVGNSVTDIILPSFFSKATSAFNEKKTKISNFTTPPLFLIFKDWFK
jgi:hypothetical protein